MGSAARAIAEGVAPFQCERLERVFNECFAHPYNTRLYGGADEPLYQPARGEAGHHALYYRQDYFASALHEVAHWCIAGAQRRQQLDFGYWYAPDGRSVRQQLAFEAVECKPQALEWFFSRACNFRFRISADNLELVDAGVHNAAAFQHAVLAQAHRYQAFGIPARAGVFYRALCSEFGTRVPLEQLHFSQEALR